jgi:hypothetical protein
MDGAGLMFWSTGFGGGATGFGGIGGAAWAIGGRGNCAGIAGREAWLGNGAVGLAAMVWALGGGRVVAGMFAGLAKAFASRGSAAIPRRVIEAVDAG